MPEIELNIVLPALCAGLLVCATHVPLGIQVLRRGIVFIDIAIAQIAGVGVIAADYFGWETGSYAVQVSALGAALTGALFLTWTERRWPDIQEGIIGTVFVLAATVQVLLLAGNPHGGEYLKDMLVGQILWVGYPQLAIVARSHCGRARCVVRHRRDAPRTHRLLPVVRPIGDCVGAGRRHLSRVFDADHPGARVS